MRPDIDLERYEAYWWLYKVALREAWALGRRQRREPLGRGLRRLVEVDGGDVSALRSAVVQVSEHRTECHLSGGGWRSRLNAAWVRRLRLGFAHAVAEAIWLLLKTFERSGPSR